jgi:hypothetical protein
VVDEYSKANAEYEAKFGKAQPLRKALMARVKQ